MDSLSVVFPIGPLRSLARKPVRRPALWLRSSLFFLSFSLFRCCLFASRFQPRVTCCPFLVCIAALDPFYLLSSSYLHGERSRSTFFAPATSFYVAFQCLRGGRTVTAIEGRVRTIFCHGSAGAYRGRSAWTACNERVLIVEPSRGEKLKGILLLASCWKTIKEISSRWASEKEGLSRGIRDFSRHENFDYVPPLRRNEKSSHEEAFTRETSRLRSMYKLFPGAWIDVTCTN